MIDQKEHENMCSDHIRVLDKGGHLNMKDVQDS